MDILNNKILFIYLSVFQTQQHGLNIFYVGGCIVHSIKGKIIIICFAIIAKPY